MVDCNYWATEIEFVPVETVEVVGTTTVVTVAVVAEVVAAWTPK